MICIINFTLNDTTLVFCDRRGSSSSSRRLGSTSERDRGDGADRSDRDRDRDRDHVREHFSRWRGSQYFGPRRWLETALRDSSWDKDSGNSSRKQRKLSFNVSLLISNHWILQKAVTFLLSTDLHQLHCKKNSVMTKL